MIRGCWSLVTGCYLSNLWRNAVACWTAATYKRAP